MEKKYGKNKRIMIFTIAVVCLFLGTSISTAVNIKSVSSESSQDENEEILKNDFSEAKSTEETSKEEISNNAAPILASSSEESKCSLCELINAVDDNSLGSYDYLSEEEKEIIAKSMVIMAEHKSLLGDISIQVENNKEGFIDFVAKYSGESIDLISEIVKDFHLDINSKDSLEFAYYELIAKSNGEITVVKDGVESGTFKTVDTSLGSGYEIARSTQIIPTMAMGGVAIPLDGSGTTGVPSCLHYCYEKAQDLGASVLGFAKSLIPAAVDTFIAMQDYWQENKDWLIPAIQNRVKTMLSNAWAAFSNVPGLTLFITGLAKAVGFAAFSAVAGAITTAIATGAAVLSFPGVKLMLAGMLIGICGFLKGEYCGSGSGASSSASSSTESTVTSTSTTSSSTVLVNNYENNENLLNTIIAGATTISSGTQVGSTVL